MPLHITGGDVGSSTFDEMESRQLFRTVAQRHRATEKAFLPFAALCLRASEQRQSELTV